MPVDALLLLFTAAAAAPVCPAAAGEPIQWIADYCMLKNETDDEVAASECIEQEQQLTFKSACLSNLHYKSAMCEILIRTGTRTDTVNQCVQDKSFRGRTVENGGAGG